MRKDKIKARLTELEKNCSTENESKQLPRRSEHKRIDQDYLNLCRYVLSKMSERLINNVDECREYAQSWCEKNGFTITHENCVDMYHGIKDVQEKLND